MLLQASKQIAALVEIQTLKSSSNITASLRQRLTLGVKYNYCFYFFLLLSKRTSPSRVISLRHRTCLLVQCLLITNSQADYHQNCNLAPGMIHSLLSRSFVILFRFGIY